jgi:hypothetical protein
MFKVIEMLKRNRGILILFFVAFVFAIGLQKWGNQTFSNLGANLVSEFIGAAFTVGGLDYLSRRRQKKEILPLIASSYEDVRIMTAWALNLWRDAYTNSVGDTSPNNWIELLSHESMEKIMNSLDIRRPANITPVFQWGIYIESEIQRIRTHAESVLSRHSHALPAEIHNAVYTIIYYSFPSISAIIAYDKSNNVPRPFHLGSYLPEFPEWTNSVIRLHEWTIEAHENLTQNNVTGIHAPYHFEPLVDRPNPTARLEPDELRRQCQEFRSWQQRMTQG